MDDIRTIDRVELVDFYGENSVKMYSVGDYFNGVEIVKIENIQRYLENQWVSSYVSIEFEGVFELSGEISYGNPTFFLPDEESLSFFPRLYEYASTYYGVYFSNVTEVMDFLGEEYSDFQPTDTLIPVKNIVLDQYVFTVRKTAESEDRANVISLNGVELDDALEQHDNSTDASHSNLSVFDESEVNSTLVLKINSNGKYCGRSRL